MTVPVYTTTKASGVTPQTTASQTQTTSGSSTAPSTSTAAPTSTYPPARPGAVAPTPTAAAQHYAPIHPTLTTKVETDSPAPPQPGPAPTPFTTTIPPPPKAGEIYHPPAQTTAPLAQPYPPQMSIPPPTSTYGQAPFSSTTISTTPSHSYPAPISDSVPRRSLEHPPGYQQNAYASEMTPDQRRAHEAAANSSALSEKNSDSGPLMAGIDTDSVWNSAKKLITTAGEKIQEAEAEVWRRVNSKE